MDPDEAFTTADSVLAIREKKSSSRYKRKTKNEDNLRETEKPKGLL